MKIGILREGKQPPDKRVPFSPEQCTQITGKFPQVEIVVQPSQIRCFSDDEYLMAGVTVQEDLSNCDVLMGVKEVILQDLIPEKTYFFFSHTIKKQVYNRKLLLEVVRKRIRLIDYEALTGKDHMRIIGFGRFAGLVGAYNGLMTFGKRNRLFDLKLAHECDDLQELKNNVVGLKLPALKIVVTGGGRVAGGAIELLREIPVRQVSVEEYLLHNSVDEPVFVQLNPEDYNLHNENKPFDLLHFFNHPSEYKGNFQRFCSQTDLLIGAAFWDPKAPVLFTSEEMKSPDFRIRVIADITCDIEGSIPSTKKASTIADPVYDYNPETSDLQQAYSSEKNITVMAVDNLPCELPKDASLDFGYNLIEKVLPHLMGADEEGVIKRATITENGTLTEHFIYLSDYLSEKE
ncbi:MAG: NAD(P)-dependent oxidoreductase [Bacteroidota bacterium]|nr:NAD(P)-dependent oxidoreductase [Bacteroidota bacterium]